MRLMSPGARREFDSVSKQARALQGELAAARSALAASETRLKSAELLQARLGQQLEQALAAVEAEAAAKDELIQERNALVGQVNELTGARNELTGQVNELTGARNALIGQVNEISGAHSRIFAELGAVTTARNELVGEVNRLTGEVARLSGAVNALTEERNALVGQTNAQTQQVNELSGALNALTEERNALVGEVSRLTADVARHVAEASALTEERNALVGEVNRLTADVARHVADASALTEERNALVGRTNAQTQQVNELSGALNALTEERNALVGKVNALTRENNEFAGRVNDLTAERNALVGKNSELTGERNRYVAQISALTGERNMLVGQVSSLTGERNQLVAQVSALTGERNSAIGLVNELSQAKGDLTASVNELKHSIGHLNRRTTVQPSASLSGRKVERAKPRRAKPRFLIVSNMRSGSTWVETLLGALPDVATDLELKWALRFDPGPVHIDLATTELDLVEILDLIGDQSDVVGSKLVLDPVEFSPVDFDLLRARIDPDVRIVHLARSYRETLLSIRRGAMHLSSSNGDAKIGERLKTAISKAAFSAAAAPAPGAVLAPRDCYAILKALLANDVFFAGLANGREHFMRLDYAGVARTFDDLARFVGSAAAPDIVAGVLAAPALEKLPEVAPSDVVSNIDSLEPLIAHFEGLRRMLAG